jgi:hypothetical protein
MKKATKATTRLNLDEAKVATLKDQILIVLADYQTCVKIKDGGDAYAFSRQESIRIEVANRIIANLEIVAAEEEGAEENEPEENDEKR